MGGVSYGLDIHWRYPPGGVSYGMANRRTQYPTNWIPTHNGDTHQREYSMERVAAAIRRIPAGRSVIRNGYPPLTVERQVGGVSYGLDTHPLIGGPPPGGVTYGMGTVR